MLHTKQKAFTLVELIVVVTILAILATIGFVSYSSYLTWVRDTNRIAQMTSLSDWLNLYSTTNDLPIPEDNVEVSVNWWLIAYQGYAGANILETINFTKWGLDPKDNTFFSYYLTRDRRFFQLMWFLEESADLTTQSSLPLKKGLPEWGGIISKTHAVNLQDRIPTVSGRKLWILTDITNIPVQDAWVDVDITDTSTDEYIAHFSWDEVFEWTWAELAAKIQLNVNYVPSFTPERLPWLFMWFDAADTTTIEKDASNIISKWNDKSWKNNHFDVIEWDPSYWDFKINGQKTVYFDGNDSMHTTESFSAPYTIMYVAQMEGTQNSRVLGGNYNSLVWFHNNTKNDIFLSWWALDSTELATINTEMFSVSRDSSKNTNFYNNWKSLILSSETIWNTDFWKLWIWWTWPSWWWNIGIDKSKVQIAEVLIFDEVISENNRLKVEAYLNSKWWSF